MANKKKPNINPEEAEETEVKAGTADLPADAADTTEKGRNAGAVEEAKTEDTDVSQTEDRPEGGSEERADLARKLAQAERELSEGKDRYLRLLAEYENYRKRTQKERETLFAEAAANTAEKFLPVYDDLERALCQQTEDAAFYKGVALIRSGLLEIFKKLDIRPIEAQGRPFDPVLHDAVMHAEDDSGKENIVAEVFKEGFTMGDRVIRHALVKVLN